VIEYTDDTDRARHEKFDVERRREDKKINFDVEMSIFASWVFLKIQSIKPISLGWVERIKQAAETFYKEHRGPDVDGKAIEDFPWQNHSYADRLEALWDEIIRVEWDNYSRIIIEYKKQECGAVYGPHTCNLTKNHVGDHQERDSTSGGSAGWSK
jgi:hypothetical protein